MVPSNASPNNLDHSGNAQFDHPQRIAINSNIMIAPMDEGIVMIDLQSNRIYSLNRTAKRLWELLNTGYSRTELQQQLLQEFDVDADQLALEIDSLLHILHAEHLLTDPH